MDSENWFSQALASPSASGVNTPTRSSTPTTRTRRAGGNRGNMVDQGLLNESVSLGKRYGEEWGQGGGGKKVAVSNSSGSPVGSPVNISTSGAPTNNQSVGGGGTGGGSAGSPSGGGIVKSSLYNVTADQLALHSSSSPSSPYTPYRRPHRLAHSSLRGSTSMRGIHKVGSPNTPSLTTSGSGGLSGGGRSPSDTKAAVVSPPMVDDDAPPAASYFGSGGMIASPSGREGLGGSLYSGGGEIQRRRTPQGAENTGSLDRAKSTATLLIIGVPYHLIPQLEPFLAQYGSISSFTPGPPDSNFASVTFVDPVVAMRLARKNGEIIWCGCLLGIVPQYGDVPGAAISPQPGAGMAPTRNDIISQPSASAFGTQSDLDSISQPLIPIEKPNVYKPKSDPKAQKNAVVPPEFGFGDAVPQGGQAQNGWAGGWLSRVGEIFFGR